MSEVRGNWNAFAASPSILSLSKDQRRKVRANDEAEDEVPGAGELDMIGDQSGIAAE